MDLVGGVHTNTSEEDRPSSNPIYVDHQSAWSKYIMFMLVIISCSVAVVVWATSSHAEIKSWTADQDRLIKAEVDKSLKDRYVPLHEFTALKQSLANQKEDLEQIEQKLDRILNNISGCKQ